ncbi:acetyl-CoA synthetase-like protein [Acephala macrosclerotiorum]|nr:acetyl-CoA synthetase-like protein [Acephala macrosclerotiorum]
MAHFHQQKLQRPDKFNFAIDVVDYRVAEQENLKAIYWASQDESGAQSLTFKNFSRQSKRTAFLLEKLGVKEEMMIMILPRIPAWWEIATVAIRSGIVILPGTTLLTLKDILYKCNKSKASTFAKRNRTSPSLVYLTSGTTGPPKIVQHSQVSYPLALATAGKHWHQLSPGNLFWNTAEQGKSIKTWQNSGATLFIHDDRLPFNPKCLLRILSTYPITTLCAPPLAYRQLVLRQLQPHYMDYPPLALSHCTSWGEALNDEVIIQWQALTGLEIHDGYGRTETVLICANFPSIQSVLVLWETLPLKFIDSEGLKPPPGEDGEIALLISNYPSKVDFFWSLQRREKSFIHSGEKRTYYLTSDKAKQDDDRYFCFVGRVDDVINSSGYPIGPFEVESTFKSHSMVAESAIISSPDLAREEVVKAFDVLAIEDEKVDQVALRKELQEFCEANSVPYGYPRKI